MHKSATPGLTKHHWTICAPSRSETGRPKRNPHSNATPRRPFRSACEFIVTPLSVFVQRMLTDGSVVLRERPVIRPEEHRQAAAWLQSDYADFRLDVAGPLLAFDADAALRAAECCRSACWFLVDHGAEDAEVEAEVKMPSPGGDPAQHLSADLVLRFLPHTYHPARAIAAADRP